VAPQGIIYQIPLLCVVEAKKDDFEKGMAQCLVEMYACHQFNNNVNIDIYGIVTNAISWEFYQFTSQNEVYKSLAHSESHLEDILGILHIILSQCDAKRIFKMSLSNHHQEVKISCLSIRSLVW
jgi:hypothetical protein